MMVARIIEPKLVREDREDELGVSMGETPACRFLAGSRVRVCSPTVSEAVAGPHAAQPDGGHPPARERGAPARDDLHVARDARRRCKRLVGAMRRDAFEPTRASTRPACSGSERRSAAARTSGCSSRRSVTRSCRRHRARRVRGLPRGRRAQRARPSLRGRPRHRGELLGALSSLVILAARGEHDCARLAAARCQKEKARSWDAPGHA